MRLKQHLLVESPMGGRGKVISEDEALDILDKKCRHAVDAYKDDKVLVRGADFVGDFQILDPKSSSRQSQYTRNYYTLMMDNDKRWKSFPKRSESIIASTSYMKAERYGTMHNIFAFDGATYGVASESDIWSSFDSTVGKYFNHLGELNDNVSWASRNHGIRIDETDYRTFLKGIKKLSDKLYHLAENPEGYSEQNALHKAWQKSGKKTFYDFFISLYDPKINGIFTTKDIHKVFKGSKDREVWTDSKAVIITDDGVGDMDIHQFL